MLTDGTWAAQLQQMLSLNLQCTACYLLLLILLLQDTFVTLYDIRPPMVRAQAKV